MKELINAAILLFWFGMLVLFGWVLEILGFSRDQVALAFSILVLLWALFYIDRRLHALEEWVGKTEFFDSKKWYRKLYDGKPIKPVHGSITPETNLSKFEEELLEFADTFADRVNKWLAYEDEFSRQSKWRLQRTGEWDRHVETCVHYKLWFNDQSFGELKLSPWIGSGALTALITIRSSRVFSLDSIWDLVRTISGPLHSSDEQLEKARQEMMFCALRALWQVGPKMIHNPDLVFRLVGYHRDQRSVTELEA